VTDVAEARRVDAADADHDVDAPSEGDGLARDGLEVVRRVGRRLTVGEGALRQAR
jgi:hypothetical protein